MDDKSKISVYSLRVVIGLTLAFILFISVASGDGGLTIVHDTKNKQIEISHGVKMIAEKELRCSFIKGNDKEKFCEAITELDNTNNDDVILKYDTLSNTENFKVDFLKDLGKDLKPIEVTYWYSTEYDIIKTTKINSTCVKERVEQERILRGDCLINDSEYIEEDIYEVKSEYSDIKYLRVNESKKLNKTILNKSCSYINRRDFEKECKYIEESKEWKNWNPSKNLEKLKSKSIIAIKSEFKIPKYDSNSYNVTFKNSINKEYKLDPPISACGDITSGGTYTLTTDLDCAGDGIRIKSDDVILDCQGHTINYSSNGLENERGIETWVHHENITIKDCTIMQTNKTGQDFRQGIVIYNSSEVTIQNNSIYTYGNDSFGIESWGTDGYTSNIKVINNSIYTYGESYCSGILVQENGTVFDNYIYINDTGNTNNWGIIISNDNVNVTGNTIEGNFHIGVYIQYTTIENGTIQDNYINGTSGGDYAIYLSSNLLSIDIIGNDISKEDGEAIYIGSGSSDINISNNTITEGSFCTRSPVNFDNNSMGGNTEGMIDIYGAYTNITNNIFTLSHSSSRIYPRTDNINISNNEIKVLSSGSNAIISYADNLTISDNNITSNSTSSTIWLTLDYGDYTQIINNNITSAGRSIYLQAHADNVNITNNIINSKTSGSSGIYIADSKGITLKDNTIESTYVGVYLTTVDNSYILENEIDGDLYTLFLDNSNNNSIYNSEITHDDYSGVGIGISSSNNNRLTNFTINSSNGAYGLYVDSNAQDNTVENGIVDTYGNPGAFGFYLYTPNENNFTNLTVTTYGGSGSSGYAVGSASLLIRSSDKSNIIDSVFSAVSSDDIQIKGTELYTTNLINTTFNEVVFHDTENTTGIKRYWYLDAQVNDTLGNPVENATIEIYDLNGDVLISTNTSSDGSASKIRITEYKQNGTIKTFLTPTTINITSNFYYTNSSVFNISSTNNLDENFILEEDVVFPTISIGIINTKKDSQTISFNSTISDLRLDSCKYSIFNSSGGIDGVSENVTFVCDSLVSTTVTAYGNYNLTVYAVDLAGNENSSTKSFTTSKVSSVGGGAMEEVAKIPTITLKQIEGDKIYNELEKAVFYARINTFCSVEKTSQTLAVQDFSGECLLRKSDIETIQVELTAEGFSVSVNDLILFYDKYNEKELEQAYMTLDIIKTYDLFTSVLGITNQMRVNPPRLDKPFIIFSDGNFSIEHTFTVNKKVKECSVISGNFECEVVTDNSVKMILNINDTDFLDEVFKGEMSITSDADTQNLEIKRISLIPRVYNLSYKIMGIPAVVILIILGSLILMFSVFFIIRGRFRQKLKRRKS